MRPLGRGNIHSLPVELHPHTLAVVCTNCRPPRPRSKGMWPRRESRSRRTDRLSCHCPRDFREPRQNWERCTPPSPHGSVLVNESPCPPQFFNLYSDLDVRRPPVGFVRLSSIPVKKDSAIDDPRLLLVPGGLRCINGHLWAFCSSFANPWKYQESALPASA